LILIDKGFPQENLTNLGTIVTFFEILISVKLSNLKKDFLKSYLSASKNLYFIFFLEIVILISYENYKPIIDNYLMLFNIFILLFIIVKVYFILFCFFSISGFFHRITDRSIGASYITALNSSNNFSEKWPGLFIFYLADIVNYKILGFVSILYCIAFYLIFRKKLIEYDESDDSDWLSSKLHEEKNE